jgi:thiol-disulfide isomerase/thioredoxin
MLYNNKIASKFRNLLALSLFLILGHSTLSQTPKPPVVSFTEIEKLMGQENDTVYILNFWATWCVPCVEELPYFEQTYQKYKNQKFRMILVSLDFVRSIESRVVPFIEKNKLGPEVWILYEPDANAWIQKVDKSWSGGIPATLFVKNKKRLFHEGQLNVKEIDNMINKFKNR